MDKSIFPLDIHPDVGVEVMAFYNVEGRCAGFDYAEWDGKNWRIKICESGDFIDMPKDINYIGWDYKDEAVDHPSHYNTGKFECRDVMIEVFGKEYYIAFCKLSAFKYIFRGGKKKDNSEKQDLKKAVWYLNDVIDLLDD